MTTLNRLYNAYTCTPVLQRAHFYALHAAVACPRIYYLLEIVEVDTRTQTEILGKQLKQAPIEYYLDSLS